MTHYANRAFWIDDYGPYTPNAPLQGDAKVDVAIVGGGFTGLSTAWNIRQQDASTSVAVLESEIVGFGASGRAQGWVMTTFGVDQLMIKQLYGLERAKQAHTYCAAGVKYVGDMVNEHNMDCDYHHPGLMQVAYGEHFIKDLEANMKLYEEYGLADEVEWLDKDAIQSEINSPADDGSPL